MPPDPQAVISPQDVVEPDVPNRNLSQAKSVTFIIHGVGETTSKELLDVTTKGFLASSIGGSFEQTRLDECPSLSGVNGADSILIQNSSGSHYVVALPWTDRHFRLAGIAHSSLKALLLTTILVILGYPFRESLGTSSLTGYAIALLLGAITRLFFFKGASNMFVGALVGGLLAGCGFTFFSEDPGVLILPLMGLLIALLVIACISIGQCIPLAPTASWRLSLVALIIALGLPVAAIVQAIQRAPLPRERYREVISDVKVRNVADDFASPNAPPPSAWETLKFSWSVQFSWEVMALKSGIVVAAICMALCVPIILFTKFGLDFALDVFDYAHRRGNRVLLLTRAADAIRWSHSRAPSAKLIVLGHSLGSAIASHAVVATSLPESILRQITLVTLGSPLNYLWRAFPKEIKSARDLATEAYPTLRWINLWRRSDLIGQQLDIESPYSIQYCIGKGGHSDYWSDGAVWKAVAREAFDAEKSQDARIGSSRPARTFIEAHMLTLLLVAIVVFSLVGVMGFWLDDVEVVRLWGHGRLK